MRQLKYYNTAAEHKNTRTPGYRAPYVLVVLLMNRCRFPNLIQRSFRPHYFHFSILLSLVFLFQHTSFDGKSVAAALTHSDCHSSVASVSCGFNVAIPNSREAPERELSNAILSIGPFGLWLNYNQSFCHWIFPIVCGLTFAAQGHWLGLGFGFGCLDQSQVSGNSWLKAKVRKKGVQK